LKLVRLMGNLTKKPIRFVPAQILFIEPGPGNQGVCVWVKDHDQPIEVTGSLDSVTEAIERALEAEF
jgi:hypothetical protein